MGYYDDFIFRFATKRDTDLIMAFLKKEWGENHILANNKEFFLWQYGNDAYGDTESLNVFLMTDRGDNILGINGFIPYSNNRDNLYVSSAITKVKSDIGIPLIGVELIKRYKKAVGAKAYYSSGTNLKTMIPLAKRYFGYSTGIMQQFYILNKEKSVFHVAKVLEKKRNNFLTHNLTLKSVLFSDLERKFDFQTTYENQGYKSADFIRHRYFEHPIYRYQVWAIEKPESERYQGVVIGREIVVNHTKILRIVDYLGNIMNLGKLGQALEELMHFQGYEYIDLVAGSLPEEIMRDSGFLLLNRDGSNIIPMYFEPFVQENVEIWYQKSDENIVIFKADGDQDRPNKW
ncbi:hypothetical protein AALB16_13270 [Lachnospiraceae bacterium 62-35]